MHPPPSPLLGHFCMPALALAVSDCGKTRVFIHSLDVRTKETFREPHIPFYTPLLFPSGITIYLFLSMNLPPLTSDHIHVPVAEPDLLCTEHISCEKIPLWDTEPSRN